MTGHRLAATAAVTATIALALAALTPSLPAMTGTVLAPQHTADTAGPEALVLAVTGLLAWGVWAWGALGLLLTAATALPGAVGTASALLTRVVLPGTARRGAALALGVGLGVAGPLAGTALVVLTAPAAVAAPAPSGVPDWPAADPGASAVPDWPAASAAEPVVSTPSVPDAPTAPAPGAHVVVRGDCLWDVAGAWLSGRLGRAPTAAETAEATHAWWSANAAVIGSDPDLLLPGQVLRPPS